MSSVKSNSVEMNYDPLGHAQSYPKFLAWALGQATNGNVWFYLWMLMLTSIFLVGANAWAVQVANGMIVTNMTDHVSWGHLYRELYLCGWARGRWSHDGDLCLLVSRSADA